MKEFQGLVAAVTGGAGGIGAATAALLTERGATTVVLDRTAPDTPHPYIRCDITDDDAVAAAMRTLADDHGRLDVLVNNAGIGAKGDVTANNREEWHRILDVNVVSMARITAAALPLLRRSDHAAVVNVSSVVALAGVRNRALYSATKGAVLSMTLAMAADHVKEGIRVNCVTPGTVDTPWIGRLLSTAPDPEAESRALRTRQPLGRLVTPEEVAHAITYLASPLSASTTGSALAVDGGMATLKV
ncbi:SDR family NAD(P)-dependent oxidoreductase [Streptomyces iranensis]|uniref:NAD(P)-dependent dehydrogenase (Short-subunit alcohol dehydrogenase family) n=1 Tax=Streptomyces iranensis TaxID=576784 RepID=A0A061AD04_9ACTN|nr:SDR family oxidoreductase [Streptomyces iranensis]MBP2063642.1 NAD(P)-dependent dehydrogenase (short-subunit alcohol dehydrogenase family) [Streptomyces iranensis]CDR17767.1 oxidoreductase [Streptomyces iranensis]